MGETPGLIPPSRGANRGNLRQLFARKSVLVTEDYATMEERTAL